MIKYYCDAVTRRAVFRVCACVCVFGCVCSACVFCLSVCFPACGWLACVCSVPCDHQAVQVSLRAADWGEHEGVQVLSLPPRELWADTPALHTGARPMGWNPPKHLYKKKILSIFF